MSESTRLRGTSRDPEFRHRRAVAAAKARTELEHYIRAVVDRAPELTPAQRDRLSVLLRGEADR